jgi:hypothetical protein
MQGQIDVLVALVQATASGDERARNIGSEIEACATGGSWGKEP